jgi:hypothetical protein
MRLFLSLFIHHKEQAWPVRIPLPPLKKKTGPDTKARSVPAGLIRFQGILLRLFRQCHLLGQSMPVGIDAI